MGEPSPEKSRVSGIEFDWFATDGDGHIGHFSTAGYGPVPTVILARLDDVEEVPQQILQMPVVGKASGHLSGEIEDWLEMARRGLFSYDWQHWSGPYRRAATPSRPVHIRDLPKELLALVRLVEWPDVRFADLRKLRPEQLCQCE